MDLERVRLITCSILMGVLAVFTFWLGRSHAEELLFSWRARWRQRVAKAGYVLLILIVVLFLTFSSLVLEQCVQWNADFPSFDDFWGWLFLVLFIRLVTMILEQPVWDFGVYFFLTTIAVYLHLHIAYALKVRRRYETLGIMEDPILDDNHYYRGTARVTSLQEDKLTVHWTNGDENNSTLECYSDLTINCPTPDLFVGRTNGTCVDIQRVIEAAPEWPFNDEEDTSNVPFTLVFGYWPTCEAEYIEPVVLRYWDAYANTSAFRVRFLFYLNLAIFVAILLLYMWYRKRKRLTMVGAVTSDPNQPPRQPRQRPQMQDPQPPVAPMQIEPAQIQQQPIPVVDPIETETDQQDLELAPIPMEQDDTDNERQRELEQRSIPVTAIDDIEASVALDEASAARLENGPGEGEDGNSGVSGTPPEGGKGEEPA